MPAYRLTSAASDDVDQIYFDGVQLFGAAQADRYHDGLEAAFGFLAETPRAARLREETRPPVRAWRYGAHVIIYVVGNADEIMIVRVRHGREDWLTDPI